MDVLRPSRQGRPVVAVEDRGYRTPCHVWQLSCNVAGYAQRNLGGRVVRVHRVVYEAVCGPVPDGQELDHLCRVKACVNPEHLEPVTHVENLRRAPRGKLTREQRAEIRRMRGRVSGGALAARFGVARSTISAVLNGQNWSADGAY